MIADLGPIAGEAGFAYVQPAPAFDGTAAALVLAGGFGARTFPALAAVPAQQLAGARVPSFGADFFERVHYSFVAADLGNVIGLQTLTLSVWNAFRRAETLNSITAAGDDGITLTGGPTLPFAFPALRETLYTITVDAEGPATVDASYTFDWQTTDATVSIVGTRITAWTYAPDWSRGLVERLEWRTDVLTAYSGREQRRALRLAPRGGWEFEFFAQGQARRYAEATAWGWGARAWALPVWPDGQALADALGAGAGEIPLDTVTRDYSAGGLAMILRDELRFEVVQVDAVEASRLVLRRPTIASWPAGAVVYPARRARLRDAVSLDRWDGDAAGARVAFELVEPVDRTASAGAATYRGMPVLERRPQWSGGFGLELRRKLAEIDNLIGVRAYEDESGLPVPMQRQRWAALSRADLEAMRRLLYALRGRAEAAWVPTWAADLVPVATIDASATAIDVEWTAYERQIALATGRRDIRIELTDGSVFYRRIGSVEQVSATVERLTIDTSLGRIITPAEVALVSYLMLARLESDAVEIAYWRGDVADLALVWRGFQHDI